MSNKDKDTQTNLDPTPEEILDFINSSKNQTSEQDNASQLNTNKKFEAILDEEQQEVLGLKEKVSSIDDIAVRHRIHSPQAINDTDVNVDISIDEKDYFLRCILLNKPFILDMFLGDGRCHIAFKASSQNRIDQLKEFSLNNRFDDYNKNLLLAGDMLYSFNHQPVYDKLHTSDDSLEILYKNIKDYLKDKETIYIDFILQAAKIFNHKLKILFKELSNEDFWIPQD